MRFLLFEHLGLATQSIRTTRTRSILTTLGIAIGIASITTILSLSGGIIDTINKQVDRLDGAIAVIRPGALEETTLTDVANPLSQTQYATSTLSEQDFERVADLPDIEAAAPLMTISGSMQAGDTTRSNGLIVATTPDLMTINQLNVRDGQFIDTVTNESATVIGQQLAIDLFGTSQPIGQTFSIRGKSFTVIGVLERQNDPVNFNNIDFDHAAIVSLENGRSFHGGAPQIQQINLLATSADVLPGAVAETKAVLLDNHSGEEDFHVVYGEAVAQPTSQLFQAITIVMVAIAGISLLVGGIGIMNIMLVNVAERTREIGLRKAVGASSMNIVTQFLIEALLLSAIGGILGYAAGYLFAFLISTMLTFDPMLNWQIAGTAAGVAIGVGLLFGLYPALRAARKDPIESLRLYR